MREEPRKTRLAVSDVHRVPRYLFRGGRPWPVGGSGASRPDGV